MELFFLLVLVVLMISALGSGFPVAFALPGAAVMSVGLAAATGMVLTGNPDAYFHSGGPYQWLSAGVTNLRGTYWEVERDTLIAIPLFIFMGIMLQRSKIAEDLLMTMAQLFGRVPGGLGISVVFVGAILAATTGIVGATVVAMGLISLPAMLRNKYSPSLASGTIAASGTLGQIIPPSIVLIILADQLSSAADQAGSIRKTLYKDATGEISMPSFFDVTSTSAGEMFLGAMVPGLLLVAIYMLYILGYAFFNPSKAPSVPYEGDYDKRFWINVFATLVPPLALIFMVLGSIITGIATVNQAGAIGAAGAMTMAGYRLHKGHKNTYHPVALALVSLVILTFCLMNFDMNAKNINSGADLVGICLGTFATLMLVSSLIWSGVRAFRVEDSLRMVMLETAKTTSLVFIILLGAAMLTAAFRAFGGEEIVRHFLVTLPGGFWFQFFVVMIVIFVLGFFLDFIEIAVVVVPIVAPILLANPEANVTAVWLGVMIGLNIQTSFLTPPFGFALFYLRGVAPAAVRTIEIYRGVVPFIFLQLLALAVVAYAPPLVNYLPNRSSLLAESSPPPRNPKLQYCMDAYNYGYANDYGDDLRGALQPLALFDRDDFPKKAASLLQDGLKGVDKTYVLLDAIYAAEGSIDEAAGVYRPVLNAVRRVEKEIRRLEGENKRDKTTMSRMTNAESNAVRRVEFEGSIAGNNAIIAELRLQIPSDWETTFGAFHEILDREAKARKDYRRSADSTYDAFDEFNEFVNSAADLDALADQLKAVGLNLGTDTPKDLAKEIKDLASEFGKVTGGGDVKMALDKLRKTMNKSKIKLDAAEKEYAAAMSAYEIVTAFQASSGAQLQRTLDVVMPLLAESIGSRKQEKLTRDQALSIAACSSHHRDVSLNF
ncbi:MAG: TRAP-type mannitol/chloroaromatic compound transport system permease large subunit [Paracoccaceae bacterium]|jgi:TRAP-type mannitol/chloroaromatic compound transport system permease large subunit